MLETNAMNLWSLLAYWLPPLVWMALIFPFTSDAVSFSGRSPTVIPLLKWLFSGLSQEQIEIAHAVVRNVGHCLEYGILAWLLFRAFRADSREPGHGRWVIYAGVMALGYALFDESAQAWLPTRSASVFDFMLDATSVLTALVALTVKPWERHY